MIALRLLIRRDGTLCVTDALGNPAGPDREFPSPHGFTYEWLAKNAASVELDGDTVQLTLANGAATYHVVERVASGVNVELVESSLFDAPPIDETKADQLAARKPPDVQTLTEGSVASVGSIHVEEA